MFMGATMEERLLIMAVCSGILIIYAIVILLHKHQKRKQERLERIKKLSLKLEKKRKEDTYK